MKVTDAMVESYNDGYGAPRGDVRAALEAVLADVPDQPVHGYVPDVQFLRMQAKCIEAESRIAHLEAKLAKVRAWYDMEPWLQTTTLSSILDGE